MPTDTDQHRDPLPSDPLPAPSSRRAGAHARPTRWGRRRQQVQRRKAAIAARPSWVGRHPRLVVLLALLVLLTPVWWSLGTALTNSGNGPLGSRFTEWVRDHGGASLVTEVENVWYSWHQPAKGGKPPKGAIPPPPVSTTSTVPPPVVVPHLAAPAPIPPFANPPVAGEGLWHPVGRTVHGMPAVYEAYMRPDPVHTSVVVGVAWMDTTLLQATQYSGSYIPGGTDWKNTAPVTPTAAQSLVVGFNSGFRMKDALGGYYAEGKTVVPLVDGAATFVVYANGTATVGQWGRDLSLTPDVVSARQNLHLLVDGGKPVSGLSSSDASLWGATLGGAAYVWRSGFGVTADGALVYVGGPNLNITTLADVLARAGAVRAMEGDINTTWVNLSVYSPSDPLGAATAANGATLQPDMSGGPGRWFTGWTRDFVTLSARPDS